MSIRIRSANGRMKVTAALNSGGGSGSGDDIYGQRTSNLLGAELDESMLKDIIKEDDNKELQAIYKDIYFHDPISGGAVDLKATLPWSDFTLVGGDDKVLQHYYDTCTRLNTLSLHPELSVDYMVTGAFVGSLIYDKTTKQLTDMIPYSYADCEIRPVPLYSTEPLLRLIVTPELKAFADDDSDEMRKVHKRVPKSVLDHFKSSETVDLDPLSTIYIPRTTLSSYQGGVSMYRRVLPMYLMERVLYRGTVTEAARRQRATLHITAGDENWMPTQADFDGLVGLFQQTERDPLSAIVATHASVQASEVRSGGDFWKWTDVTDQLGDMKMRALGINDSFLSGDMNYSTMETALTVFIEDLRTFRDRITRMFYYEKIFPLVAFLNNIRTEDINKKSKKETAAKYLSDVGSKLNNTTDWWVPQIQWHKQLRPEADREYMDILDALEQRGLPITLRMLAAAGGINLDQLVSDLGEDKKMREQIKEITGNDSDGEDEYASLALGNHRGMKSIGLLNRDYGEESMELASLGRTGKKHYQFDQIGARNRLRDNFAKAMSELSDHSNYDRVAKSINHKVKGV